MCSVCTHVFVFCMCLCTICVYIAGVTSKSETLNYSLNSCYMHEHNVLHLAMVHYKTNSCLLVAVNLQKNIDLGKKITKMSVTTPKFMKQQQKKY